MQENAKRFSIWLRRLAKGLVCRVILAPYYWICCRKPVEKGLVVLADGRQESLPYSMEALRHALDSVPNIRVAEYFHNYSFCGFAKSLKIMLGFLPLYARAEYVFLCDSYLPSTCCRKRRGTTLVQMWHSCGLMKMAGQDSPEESRSMLKTQYRNTDVFTASSPAVSDVLSRALLVPRENFSEAGVSRMDLMFRDAYQEEMRRRFFTEYPQYRGKKIVLWAPTFRGDGQNGYLVGQEAVLSLQAEMTDSCAILIKTHRLSNSRQINSPVRFSASQLLPVADVLITDYSSIYYDYLPLRRPIILYVPDYEAYRTHRGLYVDYREIAGFIARDGAQLREALTDLDSWANAAYFRKLDAMWQTHMAYCDGRSTEKLLTELGILPAPEVP
ncbi:MAG: CDP-glycerol glycerophosphotransferase family protein [Firmicutes bacterium]|nr:CDP-glycerol glycerophosphotransferase family protein [Bacillota bacterium]